MSKYALKQLQRAATLGRIRGKQDTITELANQIEDLRSKLPSEWCVRRSFAKGRKFDFASDLGDGKYGWAPVGYGDKMLVGDMDTMVALANKLAELDADYGVQRLYTIEVFDRTDGEVLYVVHKGLGG